MDENTCALAAETKVETPEGPLTVRGIAGKAVPVFVRDQAGRVRFRVVVNVEKIAEAAPVLEIVLETGQSLRVGPMQVLYKKGLLEVRASDLRPGDEMVPMFCYPEGYLFFDWGSGKEIASSGAVRVTSVAQAGSADLYALEVENSVCFFASAGILCKSSPSASA